jgi:flagellar M-ring protein FliF
VSLKGGQSLRADQVVGIQRLIGASVPEVKAEDVTVLDQHGVVLSRAGGEDATMAQGQLDARQSLESHLARKAGRLLDQMFFAGEAMVAVDVVLNHEQSKVTTEEVLGATQADRGVITRERTVTKEPPGNTSSSGDAGNAQVLTQETDYAPGRRTAQTVSQGGQIAHLNVAVVVKRNLGEAELARVRQLVATAVGLQPGRGDIVTVHSLADLSAGAASGVAISQAALPASAGAAEAPRFVAPSTSPGSSGNVATVLAGLLVLVLVVAGLFALTLRRRSKVPPVLSEQERRALLASLKTWLEPQP